MAAPARVAASLTVALLGRADSAREMLRHSLEDLGAQVVFEGDPAGLRPEQVLQRSPQVVIVNLASGVEDDIDHLQEVFDDPGVNVVFNEADVTSQLAGWDLARWARHLASKVTGRESTIPPPPPGAQPLPSRNFMPVPGAPPTPAQMAPQRPIEEFMIEAEDLVDQVPTDHLPVAARPSATAPPDVADASLAIDLGEVEGAMEQADVRPEVQVTTVPEPETASIVVLEGEAAEFDAALDLSALDAALEMERAPRPVSGKSDAELLKEALKGIDVDPVPPAESPARAPAAPSLESLLGLSVDDEQPAVASGSRAAATTRDDFLEPASAGLELVDDFIELEAEPAARSAPDAAPAAAASELEDFDFSLDASATTAAAALDDSGLDEAISLSSDLGDDGGLDLDFIEPDAPQSLPASGGADFINFDAGDVQVSDNLLDDDVAALAAQLDALESTSVHGEAVVDLDFGARETSPQAATPSAVSAATTRTVTAEKPAARPPAATQASPAATTKAAPINFDSLSLAPMDEDTAPAPSAPVKPSFDFSGLNLSLEPTEEELAEREQAKRVQPTREPARVESTTPAAAPVAAAPPAALGASFDDLLAAMDLAPAPAAEVMVEGVPHVIVLGASIGGPDALRTFLSGIPENFPALFVLVQHLENGFFERLAQQLQKASRLPVRVPTAQVKAVPGEVLVIPAGQRVVIETDGEVSLTPHTETARYTPCIDDVLRDVADRFGAAATAIIFSGMAGDAIEGAVYLTMQGGEVWAQDPASCVVSSMVDGARARGVVEFIGSPRELAERCVQKFGRH